MFWENAVEYLRNIDCHSFQTFAIVFSSPENLLVGIYGAARNERKVLSKLNCVLRKCCGVSQKWWMLELSNLCHCVLHPWKLTSRISGALGKKAPFSKKATFSETAKLSNLCHMFCTPENAVSSRNVPLRNHGEKMLELQKQMLELANLCHCVQHHWKLTSRDYWSSRNERKPLSQLKHVLRKCCGVSQKQWMLELSNFCHCVHFAIVFCTTENLLVGISGALGTKESCFLSKNVFWENAVGYLRKTEC